MLALENPRCFYNLLLAATSATLLQVAANPKRMGAEIDITLARLLVLGFFSPAEPNHQITEGALSEHCNGY